MLDLALNHKEELCRKFRNTWFSEKYKFWACSNYYEEHVLKESTWDGHQFVSLDNKGDVIGYIGYGIDRVNDVADGLSAVNFTDNKVIYGIDIGNALIDIFEKFHFRKLNFCVVIGNPIESTYDRLTKKYGGRIVGTQKEQIRLYDGKYYDLKMYEILSEDYLKQRIKKISK